MFTDALRAAQNSTVKKFHTGCTIYDRRGNKLSDGWSHVPQGRLVETPWSKHAEHHAIERLKPGDAEKAHRIVIATLSRKGNITSGTPCPTCAARIRKHLPNIKEVIATQRSNL